MNKFFSYLIVGLIGIVALSSFSLNKKSVLAEADSIEIPENINAIFKHSCFGCHNSESKNTKAKDKFMIDKLTTLKKSKLAAKLKKISEVLDEGEMPPKKFLAKYPEKDISPENAKILIEWAESAAEAL